MKDPGDEKAEAQRRRQGEIIDLKKGPNDTKPTGCHMHRVDGSRLSRAPTSGPRHVVQIKAIYGAPIDMRGLVQACEARRAA
jgi:hypothetical protein